jgi:hypothetical protein
VTRGERHLVVDGVVVRVDGKGEPTIEGRPLVLCVWCCMMLCDAVWCCVVSCGAIRCCERDVHAPLQAVRGLVELPEVLLDLREGYLQHSQNERFRLHPNAMCTDRRNTCYVM